MRKSKELEIIPDVLDILATVARCSPDVFLVRLQSIEKLLSCIEKEPCLKNFLALALVCGEDIPWPAKTFLLPQDKSKSLFEGDSRFVPELYAYAIKNSKELDDSKKTQSRNCLALWKTTLVDPKDNSNRTIISEAQERAVLTQLAAEDDSETTLQFHHHNTLFNLFSRTVPDPEQISSVKRNLEPLLTRWLRELLLKRLNELDSKLENDTKTTLELAFISQELCYWDIKNSAVDKLRKIDNPKFVYEKLNSWLKENEISRPSYCVLLDCLTEENPETLNKKFSLTLNKEFLGELLTSKVQPTKTQGREDQIVQLANKYLSDWLDLSNYGYDLMISEAQKALNRTELKLKYLSDLLAKISENPKNLALFVVLALISSEDMSWPAKTFLVDQRELFLPEIFEYAIKKIKGVENFKTNVRNFLHLWILLNRIPNELGNLLVKQLEAKDDSKTTFESYTKNTLFSLYCRFTNGYRQEESLGKIERALQAKSLCVKLTRSLNELFCRTRIDPTDTLALFVVTGEQLDSGWIFDIPAPGYSRNKKMCSNQEVHENALKQLKKFDKSKKEVVYSMLDKWQKDKIISWTTYMSSLDKLNADKFAALISDFPKHESRKESLELQKIESITTFLESLICRSSARSGEISLEKIRCLQNLMKKEEPCLVIYTALAITTHLYLKQHQNEEVQELYDSALSSLMAVDLDFILTKNTLLNLWVEKKIISLEFKNEIFGILDHYQDEKIIRNSKETSSKKPKKDSTSESATSPHMAEELEPMPYILEPKASAEKEEEATNSTQSSGWGNNQNFFSTVDHEDDRIENNIEVRMKSINPADN